MRRFFEREGKLSCETFVLMKKLFFPPPKLSFLGFSQQKQLILHHRLALHLIGDFYGASIGCKKVYKLMFKRSRYHVFLVPSVKKLETDKLKVLFSRF